MKQPLQDLLEAARSLARPAISNFRVGAVARGASGAHYPGANLEFPGLALTSSVHAEQAAVVNAWLHGETAIEAIAVTAAPCGVCRQFLNELSGAGALRVLILGGKVTTLAELLPASFGPGDLGLSGGLLDTPSHPLRAEPPLPPEDAVAGAALGAAAASYAPYSATYSGVALELEDGGVYAGRYAENAAFNPSLSPLQAALVGLAMADLPYAGIRRAVLAQSPGPASQEEATAALLAVVAPGVRLEVMQVVPVATVQESDGLDSTDTPALS